MEKTIVTIAVSAVLATGCGPEGNVGASAEHHTQVDTEFEHSDELPLSLEQSPSEGAAFTFCANPDPASGMSLTNAAWFSYLSAQVYGHPGYAGPLLAELGFDSPEGLDFDWPQCSLDLESLRRFERDDPAAVEAAVAGGRIGVRDYVSKLGLGSCAQRWVESKHLSGVFRPASELAHYLFQTNHGGHHVEFISAGSYTAGSTFEEGSTQAVFARHATAPVAIIAIRGTEPNDVDDVVADANIFKKSLANAGWPEGWGRVHGGFVAAFESVGNDVLLGKLLELKGTGVDVYITGHSLGGAVATITASRIMAFMETSSADFNLRGLYTFGSPRVGDQEFSGKMEQVAGDYGIELVRVRNGRDLVTSIPRFRYHHVGTLAHVVEGSLTFDPPEPPPHGWLPSLADHSSTGFDGEGNPVSGYYRRINDLRIGGSYPSLDLCL